MTTPEPTRLCSDPDCALAGTRQPWSNFYATQKWPDGTMRRPDSYCKKCKHRREYQRYKEMKARDPERARAYERRKRENVRRDPERWAAALAYWRDYDRRRFGYTRTRERPPVGPVTTLDADPFVEWLRTLGEDSERIARRTGMSSGHVRAMLRGEHREVTVDVVDRACLRVGVQIDEIYPLEEEEAA